MNMKSYSNTAQAFYAESLRETYEKSGLWPSDAIEVSEAQEAEIRLIHSAGGIAILSGAGVERTGLQPGFSDVDRGSQTCTPAQGLIALYALKQITETDVLTAISHIADPVQRYTAQIGYQRATVWDRASPTMQAMAQLLQLSEEDLDALFAYAVTVKV